MMNLGLSQAAPQSSAPKAPKAAAEMLTEPALPIQIVTAHSVTAEFFDPTA